MHKTFNQGLGVISLLISDWPNDKFGVTVLRRPQFRVD